MTAAPLHAAVAAARDLIVGAGCAGCGTPGEVLCARCHSQLAELPRRVHPSPEPPGMPPVWAVAAYDGAVRSVIVEHKEHARLALARPLGASLSRSVALAVAEGGSRATRVVLVPVPSAPRAVRQRGHDAAARIARRAAACLRTADLRADVWPVLRRVRAVADQAGLSAAERMVNVSGSLGVTRPARALPSDALVVIVDDVVTTGATLTDAAAALSTFRSFDPVAAVIAATRRRVRSL